MVNNNLNINLNSTVPLNSINHKSNQHRESFLYEFNKIQLKMLQRDGVVMVEMKVLVMEMMEIMGMVMIIPMKSGAMAMISPLREGISLVVFCLPESFSLSGVFRLAEAAVSNSEPPLDLGFWGR
jgi:hypothetical protein